VTRCVVCAAWRQWWRWRREASVNCRTWDTAGRRTASVSQPRQTHSNSLTPCNAFVAVS